jgi:flagellar biosynthesis protein
VADRVKQAAAVRYDEERDALPRVTALGRGRTAERIVETAFEAEVPIIEDAALVSALMMMELGDEIPVELYQAIAKILAFLYDVDKQGGAL